MLTFPILESHWRVFGLSVHDGIPLPATARAPLMHFELPHTMKWVEPGTFTSTVTVDGLKLAQKDHDVGAQIAHVSVPPANPLLPVTMAASQCKVSFHASDVTADGQPVGTYLPFVMPPVECTDVKALVPLTVLVPFPCTVVIGMTPAAVLGCWAGVVRDMARESIARALFGTAGALAGPRLEAWAAQAAGRMARRYLGRDAQARAEDALATARDACGDDADAAAKVEAARRARRGARSAGLSLLKSGGGALTPGPGVSFTAGLPHAR